MTVNILKLSVGTDGIEDLAAWQASRIAANGGGRRPTKPRLFHTTRMVPKRQADVLDGGSLYWVIRGVIQVRQPIIGFEEGHKADGTRCCLIMLDPNLIPVRPTPRRAFQGWRYLEPDDAPEDLDLSTSQALSEMPPKMRRELSELCLL